MPSTPSQHKTVTADFSHLRSSESRGFKFWGHALAGLFNKSEFQLLRRQILVSPSMLLLVINKTKTIQFGERTLKIPVLAIPGLLLCPVSWYKTLVNTIPAPGDLPALIIPEKGELKPYTYSRFQKRLKSSLSTIGKDSKIFSSHSMRTGGATSAFNAEVPSDMIQKQGDWVSEAYLRYIKIFHVSRLRLANGQWLTWFRTVQTRVNSTKPLKG